jgi:hypothetical protein
MPKPVFDKNKLSSEGLNILLVDKNVNYNSSGSGFSLRKHE